MATFSSNLEQSLHRTLAIANARRHRFATLEHLLLALIGDAEAVEVLIACGANIENLRTSLANYIETEFEGDMFFAETEEADAKPTAGFQRVVQRAVIHVQSSGREEVDGANVLVAIFAERESHAAFFLQEQDITRYDAVNYINKRHETEKEAIQEQNLPLIVRESIETVLETAPEFRAIRGKIRFRQSPAQGRLAERKTAVLARCKELQRLCDRRANEQPELKMLADRYATALKSVRRDRGGYNLFLVGLELELLLKTKNETSTDVERNPQIDGDLLFASRSLIIAHAGFVTLFPDVKQTTRDLDDYRRLGETLDPFKNRLLDPAIEQLAGSKGIFDDDTQKITLEIKELSEQEKNAGHSPSEGTTSIKHSWLRGALASIGRYLVGETKEAGKIVRDEALKEEKKEILKDPDQLKKAIMKFLESSRDTLSFLADKLPSSFGWITFLFSLLGLK
jgi:hypothetical protein